MTTDSLLQIANAGGSIDAAYGNFTTDSLVQIAAACKAAGGRLTVGNNRTLDGLLQIVRAGGGCVTVKIRPGN